MATATAAQQNDPSVYADELSAFHDAFARELDEMVGLLPIRPDMRVLDVACGDGYYTELLAERLSEAGTIIGVDTDAEMIAKANDRLRCSQLECGFEFVQGKLDQLARASDRFDLVFCAQSLYSLPEPVTVLRQIRDLLRPGGIAVVFENDSLHQLQLPWPPALEIALRATEFVALCDASQTPSKFYVGRRLPAVMSAAGLEPLGFRTQAIDRQAPLDPALEAFLQAHLERLRDRVASRLDPALLNELTSLIEPTSRNYLPRQPHFTLTWINVLAWGKKP